MNLNMFQYHARGLLAGKPPRFVTIRAGQSACCAQWSRNEYQPESGDTVLRMKQAWLIQFVIGKTVLFLVTTCHTFFFKKPFITRNSRTCYDNHNRLYSKDKTEKCKHKTLQMNSSQSAIQVSK